MSRPRRPRNSFSILPDTNPFVIRNGRLIEYDCDWVVPRKNKKGHWGRWKPWRWVSLRSLKRLKPGADERVAVYSLKYRSKSYLRHAYYANHQPAIGVLRVGCKHFSGDNYGLLLSALKKVR